MAGKYQARAGAAPGGDAGCGGGCRGVARASLWKRPPDGGGALGQPCGGADRIQPGFGGVLSRCSAFRFCAGGRLRMAEAEGDAAVAVVSEPAARRLWPGSNPLGQTVTIPPANRRDPYFDRVPGFTEARVIGVARDVLSGYLATSGDLKGSMIYFPTNSRAANNDSILVRMSGNPRDARQTDCGRAGWDRAEHLRHDQSHGRRTGDADLSVPGGLLDGGFPGRHGAGDDGVGNLRGDDVTW